MAFIEVLELGYTLPGKRLLFRDVEFRVAAGQRVALIGGNGVGKSTLLRIVAGEDTDYTGTARVDGSHLYMRQFVASPDTTVRELLRGLLPVAMRDAGAELLAAELTAQRDSSDAAGLCYAEAVARWQELGGYAEEAAWNAACGIVLDQPYDAVADRCIAQLSGGEAKRLVLEALFRSEADILLLDEPDNFLDLHGKRWLEQRMIDSSKTILFVSHDRELLSRTAEKLVTIESDGAWVHSGTFATYAEARVRRVENLEEDFRRFQEQRQALVDTMRQYKQWAALNAKFASRARASETRLRHFDEEHAPPERAVEQRVQMRLGGGRSGTIVLRAKQLAIPDLLETFDFEVRFGQRVAIVGPNGSGKSHFLRLIAGLPVHHRGEIVLGARVKVGYFSQTHDAPGWAGKTVLEVCQDIGLDRGTAMGALRRYELDRRWDVGYAKLSGGQQARLQILLLELGGSTLLALDEPTDNLDVASAEALERALAAYAGTVVAVSHDRWFLNGFDRFLEFGKDGSVAERQHAG
ncbi:MAG: ATP-binding cassette domain-containing protein [Chloroflexota bacterium]|nr:ATP-binding cassette domain-containing protein [Chloroflexota bacterium]